MGNNPDFPAFPRYLKTCLKGGIGDCIKHLTCNFALPSLHKNYGTQVFVAYEGFGINPQDQAERISDTKIAQLKNNESPWGKVLRENVFEKAPFLISVPAHIFDSIECPTVNSWFDTFGPQLYKKLEELLPLKLNHSPQHTLSKKYKNIGIQLSSNEKCKTWEKEKWRSLVEKILKKYKHTRIYLIDKPSNQDSINKNFNISQERLISTAGSPLAESISLISKLDLLIAPDSFSKYIALCNKVPSIILCADVEFMTPSDLLRGCFLADIVYNDNFKLLGVEVEENFNVKHMVKNINEISVDEVFKYV